MNIAPADVSLALRQAAADTLIVVNDPYFLHGVGRAMPSGTRVFRWTIVDSSPASPDVIPALDGCRAVAMSAFGLQQLRAAGVADAVYIPPGIASDFQVLTDPAARARVRRELAGADCDHLTMIVAVNFPIAAGDSKGFQHMLRSWAAFAADKPGARLYLHSNARPGPDDVAVHDLFELCAALGIRDRVTAPPEGFRSGQGVPRVRMVEMYNAADVLLSTSGAEGFGLPVLEAQACGVPVVTCAFGPVPEHVFWGHSIAPLDLQWAPIMRSWWAWPDVRGGTAALNELYGEWAACGQCWPLEKREAVSAQVRSTFDWSDIFRRQWLPLLLGR
jgi:glycosyltransferase involved in cell wall biosynthesis